MCVYLINILLKILNNNTINVLSKYGSFSCNLLIKIIYLLQRKDFKYYVTKYIFIFKLSNVYRKERILIENFNYTYVCIF